MNSYQSIAGFNKYAHNNYVELMVGVGLVGLVIYYLLYVYILHKNFKMMLQGNKNAIIFFTLVIVLLITEIGLESFGDETYQILLASGIAFLQIEFKRNRHINGMLIK
ncbi:hypothetical protein D3C75_1080670 [compost metagenome]